MSYKDIFRNQWWLVAATTLIALLVAGMFTVLTPNTYSASTQLFVSAQVEGGSGSGSQYAQDEARSYAEIADSSTVTLPVIKELDLDETSEELAARISAEAPLDTSVINVSVQDSDADQAAAIAEALAQQLKVTAVDLATPRGQTNGSIEVTIVKPAAVPTTPASPRPLNILVAALVLGLGLGLGLALWRDSRDNRINQRT